MTLTAQTGYSGLVATATPVNSNVTNTVKLGIDNAATTLSSATKFVTFDALIVGASSDLVIDVSDLDSTGTTAWTAGTAQVETATVTAASGITGSGNATVTVTASGMTGTPKAISVALTTAAHTTATLIATALAAGLNADTDYAALFTATSSGADVITTRKADFSATFQGSTTNVYPANDGTLNVAIVNGTCTGITAAPTSANTTAGVATAGVYVPDLDGNDFEGNATGGATAIYGLMIRNNSTSDDSILITQSTVLVDYKIPAAGTFQAVDATGGLNATDITIEPFSAGPALVEITIAAS